LRILLSVFGSLFAEKGSRRQFLKDVLNVLMGEWRFRLLGFRWWWLWLRLKQG
jgi:hypothetical protein